jgi:hypothetical protein
MGLQQTGSAVADEQRFEDAVTADGGQIIGMQQRGRRIVQFAVERDHNRGLARHGQEA